MLADRAEVSWDADKSKWLVRISAGGDVIRRYCDLPANAGEQDLRKAVQATLLDDGYEFDAAAIAIQKTQVA